MHHDHTGLRFSPSDLVTFLDSEFASWMDRWHVLQRSRPNGAKNQANSDSPLVLNGVECQRDEDDEESRLIAQKGQEHEQKFLIGLRQAGYEVAELSLKHQQDSTLEAMRAGSHYIYQARLEHENFAGYADFLVRMSGNSDLGEFHYQVWDTKLARSVKPSFIVQLCAYSEFLESIQGRQPHKFAVVLGNGESVEFELQKFLYCYRYLKRRFLEFQARFSPQDAPDPGMFSNHGRWSGYARKCLETAEHLSLVANISRQQIQKLEAVGISTIVDLARSKRKTIPRLGQPVFERLRTQARMQLQARTTEQPPYEVCHPPTDAPRRGLALLPPPSRMDVYFDIEGFPLVDKGLEYLLGVVCIERGNPKFIDWWAHDHAQERKAFKDFVEWVHARWKSDPKMHIYHYAAYEVSAMRRLMGIHAVCEQQVDDLLRNHVFVDLYTVVRQGLVIGTQGYSLKDIESLYMGPRAGDVTTASGSVVAYHLWMQSGESQKWGESPLLREIRDYNQVDCESTWKLAEWLREVQRQARIPYVPPPSAANQSEETAPPEKPSTILAQQLLSELPTVDGPLDEETQVQELLAYLLEFHWREAKPVFWQMFARHEMTEEQLIDDFDCLGGLERTRTPPTPIRRSLNYEYRYDPDQETKLHAGSSCYFAHDLTRKVTIDSLAPSHGLVELTVGPKYPAPPQRLSLIPDDYISANVIADSVYRYVEAWSQGTILSQAVDDLLHRRKPRIRGHRQGPLVPQGAELLASTIDLVQQMDQTVLCIQGPPGTGKTYTAAHAILALLQQGKSIGVTANSHKAILNVLRGVHTALQQAGEDFRIIKVGNASEEPLIESGEIEHIDNPSEAVAELTGEPLVLGGTAWLFSRPDIAGQLDYLFVDEAGQFSLANTVGVGLAAENLVLVGDQMQLAQPTLGSHPGRSGESALNYLLDGQATIPPDMGVLLDQTWRLHPDICRFISEAFYDGRLQSHPQTHKQRIKASGPLVSRESGVVFMPVPHAGNAQGSLEEVQIVAELIRELLGSNVWSGKRKSPHPLGWEDILVVAPFNYQVRLLQEQLGPDARVGTVDKFQGQEADVVIVSLASSTIEDSPRGAEFLLEPNRLNVAISRAKSLAIIVGNPQLISGRLSSIHSMELANLFCWLVNYAERGQ